MLPILESIDNPAQDTAGGAPACHGLKLGSREAWSAKRETWVGWLGLGLDFGFPKPELS